MAVRSRADTGHRRWLRVVFEIVELERVRADVMAQLRIERPYCCDWGVKKSLRVKGCSYTQLRPRALHPAI
jgi:hypothetical protein